MNTRTHTYTHTHKQSLSLLRAINKESAAQSAGLISSIAHDTAGLYATALLRIDTFGSSRPIPGVCVCVSKFVYVRVVTDV